MAISNPGGLLNSVPAPLKQTLTTNYIDFTASGTEGWAQQYLPDLMESEADVFGNRTVSGFLAQVGAEEPMSSDQVIWSEQGRLHLAYNATVADINDPADGGSDDGSGGGTLTIGNDIDGNTAGANHGIRVNDTVLIAQKTGICRALVSIVSGATVSVLPYDYASLGAAGITANACKVLVYGSEFAKGTDGRSEAATPQFKTFTNKPIILKDYYEISGSDASQIGWVETVGEDGSSGYYWYLKAEGETRMRFADYCEMSMLEAVKPVAGSIIDNTTSTGITGGTNPGEAGTGVNYSTEGLFAAIENRGNITTGVTGDTSGADLGEFDLILAEFDNQGAIEENMMFVNRATSLAIDDMLASMNGFGTGGTSYGVFENDEDMALNLGFTGFRRGSYDFYKSDFRYLNDKGTRKTINDAYSAGAIRGVIIPAGTSSVYDQMVGANMRRPFLHVRYRASQMEDRKFKTWITGSVGAVTSKLDVMQVNFLSERCLVTQGANNFMLFK
tara:strand:+ start:973 stop:2478 length:1506 start_codon:yes stop_codon:yes gene_type:complete